MKPVFASVAALFICFAMPAHAAPTDIEQYRASVAALQTNIDSGATPGPNDPLVTAAVAQINAVVVAIDTPDLPITSIDTFQSICVPVIGLAGAFGNSRVAVAAAAAPNEAARALIKAKGLDAIFESNVSALFPIIALSLKCDLAHMAVITQFVDTAPADKRNDATFIEGIHNVREGLFMQIQGAIGVASMSSIGIERRRLLADIMGHYAPMIGQTVNAPEKQTLIDMLIKARPGWLPASQRNADALLAALRAGKCSVLCSR